MAKISHNFPHHRALFFLSAFLIILLHLPLIFDSRFCSLLFMDVMKARAFFSSGKPPLPTRPGPSFYFKTLYTKCQIFFFEPKMAASGLK